MIITAVRHGETNENAAGIAQGQSFGTLSPRGEQQIAALGEQLRHETYDVVFSSDLPRCKATAAAIMAYHPELEIIFDKRLRERSCAPLEGRPFAALGDPEIRGFDIHYKTSHGESWTEVRDRVAALINEILARPYERVLLVTHGGVLRCLDSVMTDEPLQATIRNHYDNCAVRVFDIDATTVR